jgi:N-acetylmuramoyl-L-alanine amidase
MAKIAIQKGHCFRKTGATGTNGEQEFNNKLGNLIAARLKLRGHTARIFLADESPPGGFDAAIALHADGSVSSQARGASIGYPDAARYGQAAHDRGRALGRAWKQAYQAHGWPGGFRADNYTTGLSRYYGHRRALDAGIPRSLVVEHGFMTNAKDRAWMLDHLQRVAQSHVDAVETVFDHPAGAAATPTSGVYVVQKGDTLFGIAQRFHVNGGWRALCELNRNIIGSDCNKIVPGQKLRLP